MFIKQLIVNVNSFNDLKDSCKFTEICNGRLAAVLVDDLEIIPIVRTTTKYNNPAQKFKPIHYYLISLIKKLQIYANLRFNNALIEIYDNNYHKMKFHSDQALDLEENSFICIYSCYEHENYPNRTLEIKNKSTGELTEIILDNNSIVMFSLETNSNNLHKIKLSSPKSLVLNKWLGITFRLSKTFIRFSSIPATPSMDTTPIFLDSTTYLRLANQHEEQDFFNLRKKENNEINFKYPLIFYTISPGDLINPINFFIT